MTYLSLNVLGPPRILLDDSPIAAFVSDKVRALLFYLAVEADLSQTRSRLIGLLWPDYPEREARHSLSQALFNLRQVIGDQTARPPYLLVSRDKIQFNRETDYNLDLDRFNTIFNDWEKNSNQEGENATNSISQLEEMVELYRGEFLQHFSLDDSAEYEAWLLARREVLHQRVLDALSTLADHYERLGEYFTVRRYCLRQLELDPWREEAHCQLMRVLALDGQRSAALAQYESCRKVLVQELGVEPSQPTRDLYEQIRLGTIKPVTERLMQVTDTPLHNLPSQLTPFLGREQELTDLDQLINDPEHRCITLIGPGGIGKTRLALQAAEQQWNAIADGVAFIPLASVTSLQAVIPAIASGINFSFYGPTDPKIQLMRHLHGKQMLLIMDNVEHLLAEDNHSGTIADLLIEILQQAPQVKLLVTSRENVNFPGEWPFVIEGLSVPEEEHKEGKVEYSALALFIQRARQAYPGFGLKEEDKSGVVRICRLVEGMPLAIELAATWVRLLSPAEIAAEIEKSLDFLNTQMRGLPERHRSMRAVFDRSWQLLSDEEKMVLSRLSVFRGGFNRQAAEQVADASLPVLSSLVSRSLLRRIINGRYDLHELIRQYAASKLAEDPGELRAMPERHSRYFLALLEEQGAKLQSYHQKEAVAELMSEMDNLRAAWNWLIIDHRYSPLYQVSARLMHFFEVSNWFKEGELTFRNTAESLRARASGSEPGVADQVILNAMLAHWGFFLLRLGKGDEAYSVLSPSAAFLRSAYEQMGADSFPAIYSHMYLGIDCWILGMFNKAQEALQLSLTLAQAHGQRWHEALNSEFLGRVVIDLGECDQARQYLSKALSILKQLGDPSMTAHTLNYLGRTMLYMGDYDQAEKLLQESLRLARDTSYLFAVGLSLDGLGKVASACGRYKEAQDFFLESAELFQEMGDTHRQSRTLNHLGQNSLATSEISTARDTFQAALKLAHEGGFLPSTLHALAGLAALESKKKASQEIFELIIYIQQHPSSNRETKSMANQLRVELESGLSKEEIGEAQQRARLINLDEIVHKFLI